MTLSEFFLYGSISIATLTALSWWRGAILDMLLEFILQATGVFLAGIGWVGKKLERLQDWARR